MKILLHKKLNCTLFGHKLVVTKDITKHIREYKCTCCELEFTNNYKGMKSILTPELKDVNTTVMNFYIKRHNRLIA
ncbi:Transposase [Flavobacterium jumunjinense]